MEGFDSAGSIGHVILFIYFILCLSHVKACKHTFDHLMKEALHWKLDQERGELLYNVLCYVFQICLFCLCLIVNCG